MAIDRGRGVFDKLMRGLVRVPKAELDEMERKHKSSRKRKAVAQKKKR